MPLADFVSLFSEHGRHASLSSRHGYPTATDFAPDTPLNAEHAGPQRYMYWCVPVRAAPVPAKIRPLALRAAGWGLVLCAGQRQIRQHHSATFIGRRTGGEWGFDQGPICVRQAFQTNNGQE